MPVQINEMIIRAHIDESDEKEGPPAKPAAQGDSLDKDAIIRECTEVVMELLNRKNER
ncbi:MAG TPA: DUF5908 family protein [Puia sp.]|nr:DUF5908 family protein [Puia sp.]